MATFGSILSGGLGAMSPIVNRIWGTGPHDWPVALAVLPHRRLVVDLPSSIAIEQAFRRRLGMAALYGNHPPGTLTHVCLAIFSMLRLEENPLQVLMFTKEILGAPEVLTAPLSVGGKVANLYWVDLGPGEVTLIYDELNDFFRLLMPPAPTAMPIGPTRVSQAGVNAWGHRLHPNPGWGPAAQPALGPTQSALPMPAIWGPGNWPAVGKSGTVPLGRGNVPEISAIEKHLLDRIKLCYPNRSGATYQNIISLIWEFMSTEMDQRDALTRIMELLCAGAVFYGGDYQWIDLGDPGVFTLAYDMRRADFIFEKERTMTRGGLPKAVPTKKVAPTASASASCAYCGSKLRPADIDCYACGRKV